ncbi:MAG TPA: flagellar biosynthesis protein FlhB [Burkholderiales bacterium]|jgi:flagellar biosynthetic protein FlhB|nr:flagellar biosynthesis protein FlhB [Burkholderiales bacterium]
MADEQDTERELPASQKRLDEARERGQVPRSRELTTAVLLIAGATAMLMNGPGLMHESAEFLQNGLTLTRASAFDTHVAMEQAGHLAWHGILIALPVLATLFVAASCSQLAIGGWLFTTQSMAPDFNRMNPLKGLSNMFSVNGLTELLKSLAKVSLVGGAAAWVVWRDRAGLVTPLSQNPGAGFDMAGSTILKDFLFVAATLILVAVADVPLQLWRHAKGLRMSREEVKREAKETDGDPHIKGKIRQRQREAARRRMMSNVPKADVIVTNPTHYAVALAYDGDTMRAPKVVAKGADEVAARIRELGAEHGVPLLEAPPLARALYAHAELEQEIPAALFNAVAQALAYVFQLRSMTGGRKPQAPTEILVPAELDPLNQGAAA